MQLPSTLITDMEVVDPMQPLCKQILLNITYRSYLPSILKCLRLLNWPAWVQITSIFPFWDKDIFQFWLDFGASWAVPEVICHVATAWAVGPGGEAKHSSVFIRIVSVALLGKVIFRCVCGLSGFATNGTHASALSKRCSLSVLIRGLISLIWDKIFINHYSISIKFF